MPEPLPGEIREIADRQHGVLTAGQLAQAGLTRNAVRSKVRLGRWQQLHRGVYATFSGEPGRLAVLWAAVLSAGPGAMLSHQTAAELSGLADQASEITHVRSRLTGTCRGRQESCFIALIKRARSCIRSVCRRRRGSRTRCWISLTRL